MWILDLSDTDGYAHQHGIGFFGIAFSEDESVVAEEGKSIWSNIFKGYVT